MAAIEIVCPEEFRAVKRELAWLRAIVERHVTGSAKWLRTEEACQAAGGIRRETLVKYARAVAPGISQQGRITYRKRGTTCLYLESDCLEYAARKQGLPTLQPTAP